MNNIILPRNHGFLTSCSDTQSLCAPLFQQYNINMFVYGRYYHDGSFILLSDNADWVQYHLGQGYMAPAPIPFSLLKREECFHIIPSDGPFSLAKQDIIQRYHSDKAVDYVIRNVNYFEVFCFSFNVYESNAINIIINHLARFKEFANNFKEKMISSIRQVEKHRIMLPAEMSGISTSQLDDLLNKPRQKNIAEKQLTKRELEVIKWTVKGKTAKETASRLNLSYRTVEYHLEKAKHKTNTHSKSQLIELFFNRLHLDKHMTDIIN